MNKEGSIIKETSIAEVACRKLDMKYLAIIISIVIYDEKLACLMDCVNNKVKLNAGPAFN